jgi:hypothetical protein
MPHYPKPFFRAPRGLWYVQLDGRQVNLGPDRDEAFRSYHDLMARGRGEPEPATGDAVVSILDAFLDCLQPPVEEWRVPARCGERRKGSIRSTPVSSRQDDSLSERAEERHARAGRRGRPVWSDPVHRASRGQ